MAPFASVMVLVAVVAQALLLGRLRHAERRAPWWLGYARDGGMLGAILMYWGGYVEAGLSAAEGMLAAMLSALAVYLTEWLIAGAIGARALPWLIALGIGWAAVVGTMPERVERSADRLLAAGMATGKN